MRHSARSGASATKCSIAATVSGSADCRNTANNESASPVKDAVIRLAPESEGQQNVGSDRRRGNPQLAVTRRRLHCVEMPLGPPCRAGFLHELFERRVRLRADDAVTRGDKGRNPGHAVTMRFLPI